MPSVRLETLWLTVFEVLVMVVQLLSQALPSCFLYSQRVRVALPPPSEEEMVRALPAWTPATLGVAGFGGRVGKAEAVASSVEQVLSLYALKV